MNIQELDVVRLKDGREWHGVVDTYNQADEFEDGEEESIDIYVEEYIAGYANRLIEFKTSEIKSITES